MEGDSYYITDDRFLTQDVFRTIHISFQPYIPFTEAYEMSLQNAKTGGAYSFDPASKGYFRLAPRDIEGSTNPNADARDYPMRHKAAIYNSKAIFPRASKMAMAHNRRQEALEHTPDSSSQRDQTLLGAALSSIIGPSKTAQHVPFTLDGRAVADKGELAMHTVAQILDDNSKLKFNSRGEIDPSGKQDAGQGSQAGQYVRSDGTVDRPGQGFDYDLKAEASGPMNSMMKELYGNQLTEDVRWLEISNEAPGGSKHLLSAIDISTKDDKLAITKWAGHIEKNLTKQNIRMASEWKKLKSSFGPQHSATDRNKQLRGRFKQSGKGGGNQSDYEIRQALDRYIRNKMNPYFTQHNFENFTGIFLRQVKETSKGPQFDISGIKSRIRVIYNTKKFKDALVQHAISMNTSYEKKILADTAGIGLTASNRAMLNKSRIARLDTYTRARVGLDGRQLRLTVGRVDDEGGNAQLHRVSLKISEKMRKDINAHAKKPATQGALAAWYRQLMERSNSLTKSWYNNLINVKGHGPTDLTKAGKNKEPASISEEFLYGKHWKGPRKKYFGVWNAPNEDTWKGGRGYNMSMSPVMEARRKGF